MEIVVELGEKKQLKASFNGFTVMADEPVKTGGEAKYPEPYDFFLVSLATCASFYIRSFCDARGISMEGFKLVQNNSKDESNPEKRLFTMDIQLPAGFPDKYKKAVMAAANKCTVKKTIQGEAEFRLGFL